MRQFKLINANGKEFNLMNKDSFFYNPAGLGFGYEAEFSRVGDSAFTANLRNKLPAPSGNITFKNYSSYMAFLSFCRVGGIVFCYKPQDVWRYLDVTVSSADISEISNQSKRIDCPVTFTATSCWYEKITAVKSAESMSGGKKYPYKYNYSYKDGRPGIIDIPNGLLPSPCKIHIFGPCENPTFTLTQSGKRIATGRVFIKLTSGRKLVIDSDPLTMSIAEYTADNEFIASRYANSDFETDRIFNLPPGDSKMVFTQSGSGVVTAFVEVKKLV